MLHTVHVLVSNSLTLLTKPLVMVAALFLLLLPFVPVVVEAGTYHKRAEGVVLETIRPESGVSVALDDGGYIVVTHKTAPAAGERVSVYSALWDTDNYGKPVPEGPYMALGVHLVLGGFLIAAFGVGLYALLRKVGVIRR